MNLARTLTHRDKISQWQIWHISSSTVLHYAIRALPLALLSDTPDSLGLTGFLTAKTILYSVLLISLFRPTRDTLTILMMLAIVGQDITQTTDEQDIAESLMASVWQGQLGILRPSWMFIAYYFIILMKSGIKWIDRPVARGVLFFATVPFVTGWFYGAFQTSEAFLEIPADAKLPLFLLMTILLSRNEARIHPTFAGELLSVFLGSVLARHALDCAYFVLGLGAMWDGVQRVSVDSTKGTVVLVFLLSQFLMFRRSRYLLGAALAIASGLLLLVFTTRGLWLSTIFGVGLFCCMMRAGKVLSSLAVAGAILCGTVYVIALVRPDNFELASKRFHSKTVHGSDNFFENQDPARYYQVINAWDATKTRNAVLWGSGYGSYYTESVERFTPELRVEGAFPPHSLRSGQFYTLHHFVLKMLFKYGIVGFLILAGLWVVPGWRCFQMVRNSFGDTPFDNMMAMVAFLPTSMLEISWTTKGMIVCGFAISICMSAYDAFRDSRTSRASSPAPRCLNRRSPIPDRDCARVA